MATFGRRFGLELYRGGRAQASGDPTDDAGKIGLRINSDEFAKKYDEERPWRTNLTLKFRPQIVQALRLRKLGNTLLTDQDLSCKHLKMHPLIRNLVRTVTAPILPWGNHFPTDVKRRFPKFQPHLIFDVGANIGQTINQFRMAFKGCEIISFEPDPDTYSILEKKRLSFLISPCSILQSATL